MTFLIVGFVLVCTFGVCALVAAVIVQSRPSPPWSEEERTKRYADNGVDDLRKSTYNAQSQLPITANDLKVLRDLDAPKSFYIRFYAKSIVAGYPQWKIAYVKLCNDNGIDMSDDDLDKGMLLI